MDPGLSPATTVAVSSSPDAAFLSGRTWKGLQKTADGCGLSLGVTQYNAGCCLISEKFLRKA